MHIYIYRIRDGLSSRGACECVRGITLLYCSVKTFEENKKLRASSSSSFVLVRSRCVVVYILKYYSKRLTFAISSSIL